MKSIRLHHFSLFLFYTLLVLASSSCNRKPKDVKFNEAFLPYLSAYTSGEISRFSSVKIRFADEVVKDAPRQEDADLLDFSPRIKGKVQWIDNRTLEFVPEDELEPGTRYTAELNMKKVYPDIPKDLREFEFQFLAKARRINVSPISVSTDNNANYALNGYIQTSDREDPEAIKKLLRAVVQGNTLPIEWFTEGNKHAFRISDVPRGTSASAVKVSWNGKPMGISGKGKTEIEIPAKGDFKVLNVTRFDNPKEKYIVLEFSDPIDQSQSLEGLIRAGKYDLTYSVEGNKVKAFASSALKGKIAINVSKGVRNADGLDLKAPFATTLEFDDLKPEVRLVGKGVIMPRAETLPFIFEAAALEKVDVRIIKINEKSVPQFLQVNNLDGDRELKRVGKVVLRKTLDLRQNPELDLNTWNFHSFDIAKLVNAEPGAIYEVAIGFKRAYVKYDKCSTTATEPELDEEGREMAPVGEPEEEDMLAVDENWDRFVGENEMSYWDYWEDDYDPNDDPCTNYYYNSKKVARRNVLASDLGLIAKHGDGGTYLAVTNLKTTSPMKGIVLEIYDYQNELILSTKTDNNGQVFLNLERRPHLVIAKDGTQRGYLRMDDGSALLMSRYDVSGQTFVKGLKGFIYGERGVWRPGDEMFINFMLEDKLKTLPANHPVSFELIGPRGQVVQRIVKTQGLNGLYNFTCKTEDNAFTGNYLARVRVGGAVFEKTLKVETVMPNRLKLDLDWGLKRIVRSSAKDLKATLSVNWLHGAVAKNLKADVKVSLIPAKTEFKKFGDFVFDDPARKYYSEEAVIFEGNLNDQGKAMVPGAFKLSGDAPGIMNANFNIRAFEPGGNFSTGRFTVPYFPYDTYVGVKLPKGDAARKMLLTDVDHSVRIATVDKDGNPVARSNVKVALYKLEWKWWFDQDNDEVSAYRGKMSSTPISEGTISTGANGEGDWKFQVNYPEWGRYLVRVCDDAGHCTGQITYIDWPGWAGRSDDDNYRGPAALEFTSDKGSYDVGQTVQLSIPTPNAGRALITVEKGNKVLEAHWIESKVGVSNFSFKVSKEMAPNVYITVSLLQPHAQTANDLPMRMYGVVPIGVVDPTTRIEPTIAVAESLKPDQDFTVKVGEKGAGPMTYTIAVVDEGLLGLTRFQTPSPWDYFYQREALLVKTWDLYDQVLGAFKGEVKSLLSIGGDAAALRKEKPDRFKPVVMYAGPFELKKGETKSHTFHMPNYFGEVRVMVVASTPDGAYGKADKPVKVKQSLMVMGTLPRVLSPNEELSFPLTVFANEADIKDVKVKLETGGLVEVADGGVYRNLKFSEPGEEQTSFNLKVKPNIGRGTIKAIVTSGGYSSEYSVDIEVRAPNPEISNFKEGIVEAGKTWSSDYVPVGITGTNEGTLEMSFIPPINLIRRLKYLIQYPYGCVEQTTSGVLAQLYLPDLSDLTVKQAADVEKFVKAGIARLQGFQNTEGGFVYWPGQTAGDDWATSYVGHFMIMAKKKGYTVSSDMMTNWTKYQQDKARAWSASTITRNDYVQAYRLFTLALSGAPEMGSMNRFKANSNISPVSKWLLAASYYMAGQKDVAKSISTGLGKKVGSYREQSYTYGSGTRDEALILLSLSIMQQKGEALEVLKSISSALASEDWHSTHTTGMALAAVADYVGTSKEKAEYKFAWRTKGGTWNEVVSKTPIARIALSKADQNQEIEVKNNGTTTGFPRLVASGIPMEGSNAAASNGLKLEVSYQTLKGQPVDVASIVQGTDFVCVVKVTNTASRRLEGLALNQMFAAGWEIHNARLNGDALLGEKPDYQDIRDDRVYSFFNLNKGASITLKTMLNASYKGTFYLPTIEVEAMYDKSFSARHPGSWTKVIAGGAN